MTKNNQIPRFFETARRFAAPAIVERMGDVEEEEREGRHEKKKRDETKKK